MSLKIPEGEFAAYLFDCDGTIANSMPLHFRAWNEALGLWGGSLPLELFLAWAGIPVPKTVELLNEKFRWNLPVSDVTEEREKRYLSLLPTVKPVPEVLEQIKLNHGKIPLAVVSGSPRASVERTLSFLGLLDRFSALVGGEEGPGKPNPDPYLLAAERLGVEAKRCLVFEDAELGIESARRAGMQWVKVDIPLNFAYSQ